MQVFPEAFQEPPGRLTVSPAVPSMAAVPRAVKWARAPALPLPMAWHSTHWIPALEAMCRVWKPE